MASVMGIKYWALWYPPPKKPAYDVFIYSGFSTDKGSLVFQCRRNPTVLLFKAINQLNRDGFYPFLIDIKQVDEYCKSKGWEGPL